MANTRGDDAKLAILKALRDLDGTAGAARLGNRLAATGVSLQPRTIRYYLLQLDREGLTRFVSKRRGREITDRGREELQRANVVDKLGFIAAKVDTLGYQMSFNAARRRGTVIFNLSHIDRPDLNAAIEEMTPVFGCELGMGTRLAVIHPGRTIGGASVPSRKVALATVCSVSVNGMLQKQGIPVVSRYGGLLELRHGAPVRFVELIEYGGTTIDPLEAFVRAGMTRVRACAKTGSGIVGASFREIPSVAIRDVRRMRRDMTACGMSGILAIGKPNQPLLDVPVAEGRAGIVVVGGLNPVAALHEAGMDVSLNSLSGLADFSSFQDIQALRIELLGYSPGANLG